MEMYDPPPTAPQLKPIHIDDSIKTGNFIKISSTKIDNNWDNSPDPSQDPFLDIHHRIPS